jgi:hypothetical protein
MIASAKIKKQLIYFWLPRIALCAIIIINYKSFHLSIDSQSTPNTAIASPDSLVYLNTFRFNPLYSVSLRFANLMPQADILKTALMFIISGISTLSILKSTSKIIPISQCRQNLAMFLLSIHPFLCLYALKFCTENFLLLGVAYFARNHIESFKEPINSQYKSFLNVKGFVLQMTIFLFRAQSFPLLAFESFTSIRKSKLKSSKYFPIFVSIVLFTLIIVLIASANQYLMVLLHNIWDGVFFLKPADIYNNLNFGGSSSPLGMLFKLFTAITIYLGLAILTLLGARGRVTDLPWRFKFANLEISNFTHSPQELLTLPSEYIGHLDSHDVQIEILYKIIIPFIFFASFHLVGSIKWIASNHINQSPKAFYLYPYTIILAPLLFFPYMRYFYSLIPFAVIGLCLDLTNRSYQENTRLDFFSNK